MSVNQDADIAIVGMSGVYAGAADLRAYWRNILGKHYAVTTADADWSGPYVDPDSDENDRIYTNRGGFLGDLAEFDPIEFGIMPSTIDGGSPDQYLGLRMARDALVDAGYGKDLKPYDGERSGVILGCGAYFNRGHATVVQHGVAMDQALDLVRRVRPDFTDADIRELRASMKAQLPKFNTEMAPGLVPNVASGIIANRLNLMGVNYLVDAACASTLLAVEQSIRELKSGNIDMMITGGVQSQNPPQVFMMFSQLGALSRGEVRPFGSGARGTLLGEGAGMFVLKRVETARRDGDRIYAVIKGVGGSSDGRAKGLLAPRLEGEVLALQRAYANAGVDPATVGLVEAHGTGISLGDATEIQALSQVFGDRQGDHPDVAIGSVKSMIAHCLPAAGSASIIKSALALSDGILPPTLCDEVNPDLGLEDTRFYVNNEARPWVHSGDTPRRAGVNAFGFGGVNSHVVLEAYAPEQPVQVPVLHTPAGGHELLVLRAESAAELAASARRVAERIQAEAGLDLGGLALALARRAADTGGDHRLALTATSTETAAERLQSAADKIDNKGKPFKTRSGIVYGHGDAAGRIAFLFPGEGSQYGGMLGDLAMAFPQARAWFDLLEATYGESRDYRPSDALFPPPTAVTDDARQRAADHLYDMDMASESVFTASQAINTLLKSTGLTADAMVGHSTGENSALVASGHLTARAPDELSQISHAFNRVYQQLDARGEIATGTLLTVGAMDSAKRAELLSDFGDRLMVAMDNCPNQAVLFGAPEDVSAARETLSAEGAICSELPFGRAYHTEQFQPVVEAFREFYEEIGFGPSDTPLISCATGEVFPDDAPGIRDLACAQWARPVRFRSVLENLYDDGYRTFVEVGPSANLTAFVTDTLRSRGDINAISTNSRRQSDTGHFLGAAAQLFALGAALDPSALYAHRDVPTVDPDTPAEPRRQKPRLQLSIPPLAPGDDWQAPPMPKADTPAASGTLPAASDVATSSSAPASSGNQQTASTPPADPRLAAVQSHFSLMNEFLASQARVMGLSSPAQTQPATDAPADATPRPGPLLGPVVSQSADQLVIEQTLDLARESYLHDHCLSRAAATQDSSLTGLAVVPFTFSMEMLAEAALHLAGPGQVVTALENVAGNRWLALPLGQLSIRISVERDRHNAGQFVGRIDTLDEQGQPQATPVFSASVVCGPAYAEAPTALAWPDAPGQPPRVNTAGTLYSQGMFHGPRLQGVQAIERCAEQAIDAELAVLPTADYLADDPAPAFAFDPALLDAAGQVLAYLVTEHNGWRFNCFPYYIRRVALFASPSQIPAGTALGCRCRVTSRDAQSIAADFDVADAQGRALIRVEGWTDRCFEVPDWLRAYRTQPVAGTLSRPVSLPGGDEVTARWLDIMADGFLEGGGGVWLNTLAGIVLNRRERGDFQGLPATGPRRGDWLAGRIAVKEAVRDWLAARGTADIGVADIEIVADAAGKPWATIPARPDLGMPSVSLSHSRRRILAAACAADCVLGVDLQGLQGVKVEDVASGGLAPAEQQRLPDGDNARSVVAAWSAKEAAAKAAGTGLQGQPQAWELQSLVWQGAIAQVRIAHASQIFDVQISADDQHVQALCLHAAATAARAVNG